MMGFGFGGFGFIFMLIFWVVIIALAVWLLSNLFPRVTSSSPFQPIVRRDDPFESPLEILQQRYARGEISRAEYEEMRRALQE
jgi:putative membrane protein